MVVLVDTSYSVLYGVSSNGGPSGSVGGVQDTLIFPGSDRGDAVTEEGAGA
jgi:hypothetical protein